VTEEAGASLWIARIWADRDHYELVRARPTRGRVTEAVAFPVPAPDREVVLTGDEVRIGRRGTEAADDADAPEIDLGGPPRDPGVSHLHAVLLALPPDRWVVLDAGSTNGTSLNYGDEPLPVDTPVRLHPGDHIHVGAWTTITLRRR
jgi:pSer/pThr/pTyr-binding forkhead associated (FHA) protein